MNVYEKFLNKEPLTLDEAYELMQRRLYDLIATEDLLDISDPEAIEAGHQKQAIRFCMELIQRVKR